MKDIHRNPEKNLRNFRRVHIPESRKFFICIPEGLISEYREYIHQNPTWILIKISGEFISEYQELQNLDCTVPIPISDKPTKLFNSFFQRLWSAIECWSFSYRFTQYHSGGGNLEESDEMHQLKTSDCWLPVAFCKSFVWILCTLDFYWGRIFGRTSLWRTRSVPVLLRCYPRPHHHWSPRLWCHEGCRRWWHQHPALRQAFPRIQRWSSPRS